jgi:hypothetical protein
VFTRPRPAHFRLLLDRLPGYLERSIIKAMVAALAEDQQILGARAGRHCRSRPLHGDPQPACAVGDGGGRVSEVEHLHRVAAGGVDSVDLPRVGRDPEAAPGASTSSTRLKVAVIR